MVELTHGGTWLNWSTLDRRDRNWALLSMVTAPLAAIPIGLYAGHQAYIGGYKMGSGGRHPGHVAVEDVLASPGFAYACLAALILAMVSAFAWWRFSRNQDEMFNRIQNYAIAQAGGWTFAGIFTWWMLELGGWVGPMSAHWVVALGALLLTGFWFYAVRRWL